MSQDKRYEILWTDLADESYAKELDFIHSKWNVTEVVKFMDLVGSSIENLELGVVVGKASKKTGINSLVISKQTTVFFDISEDKEQIELLLFWNNQEDPKKLSKLLKAFRKK